MAAITLTAFFENIMSNKLVKSKRLREKPKMSTHAMFIPSKSLRGETKETISPTVAIEMDATS
jgi:hypothetical protein